MSEATPFGIYLHIPYCKAKCRYCDFYSAPGARGVPQSYVDALLRELAKIDGIRWIRLHYLYPEIIDDELIDLIANEDKIVKYLDIPIQHIDNDILRRMNRHCTGDEIRALREEGLTGGFMAWNAACSLTKLEELRPLYEALE